MKVNQERWVLYIVDSFWKYFFKWFQNRSNIGNTEILLSSQNVPLRSQVRFYDVFWRECWILDALVQLHRLDQELDIVFPKFENFVEIQEALFCYVRPFNYTKIYSSY